MAKKTWLYADTEDDIGFFEALLLGSLRSLAPGGYNSLRSTDDQKLPTQRASILNILEEYIQTLFSADRSVDESAI